MKFEDLFKAKQPENYVEYPPKAQPSLEQFLANKTAVQANKATVQANKATTPLHPQEVEQIKKEYSTNPVQITSQEIPTESDITSSYTKESIPANTGSELYAQTSSSMPSLPKSRNLDYGYGAEDMKKIKEMAGELSPKMGFADYLAHLSPILVEAIAGGGQTSGSSFGIAGENILKDIQGREKRTQTLEDKLLDMEKSRMLASYKARSSDKPLTKSNVITVDENGKPVIQPIEEAIGKQEWQKPFTGLTFDQRKELETLRASLKSKAQKEGLDKKEQDKLRDIELQLSKEWSTLDFTKETRKIADANKAIQSMDENSKDPMKDVAGVFKFMKLLDPGSTVRESEQASVFGARSWGDVINNVQGILSRQEKLTTDQIRSIKRVAQQIYEDRLNAQKSTVDRDFLYKAKKYGLDPRSVVGDLSTGTPLMFESDTGKTKVIVVPNEDVPYYLNNKEYKAKRVK